MSVDEGNGPPKQIFSFAASLPPLNMANTNLAMEWKSWSRQFKIFLLASNLVEQSDVRKVAILLHHMGPEALEVFNSFNVEIEAIQFDALWKKFEEYFIPKKNVSMERHKFFTRKQAPDETISQYATALENLSITCEFGSLREDLVKDIFICGLSQQFKNIKEKLLSDGDVKWNKALSTAKSIEMARDNAAEMQNETDNVVAVLKNRKGYVHKNAYSSPKQQQFMSDKKCGKCGQTHKYKCPAEGVVCHVCKKPNHFAKMCYRRQREYQKESKYVRKLDEEENGRSEEEEEDGNDYDLFVGVLQQSKSKILKEWNIDVEANGIKVSCQVDSGSQANLIPSNLLRKLKINKIQTKIKNRILTFSGEKLPVIGEVNIKIKFKENSYEVKFYVLDMDCKVVLGLDMAVKMNLIQIVNLINKEDIFEKYSEVFDGLGLLKNMCHLQLKENSQPVVDPPRRVPFSLLEPLKRELERMQNLNVIVEETEPTEWVNSIVLVTKPNGSLRLCLDPRNLNKVIVRPRYSFPNIDECKSRMSGSKYFSTLDANSGFWMIPLSEDSSKLCTFATPFGRYRFLRLPFGINSAPEIFHAEMVRLFGYIKGLIIYMDDFMIHASTVEEHNIILAQVLERAKLVGLRFNRSKSNILRNEIKFIGHIFSEKGVRPDNEKIKSIVELPTPKNIQELQRFLGMVNYLDQFIENLSAKNKHLRDLLKKETLWHWGKNQEDEFNNLRREITNSPVLTYYDPMQQITLSVDASKFAMGAVILHDKRPIAYASASLTDCQANYAQIEKELFAILFGCTRFHQYVYGHKILVETDHKPLVSLFDKPLHKIPPRLQRFMMRLLAYDLIVTYKPGKYLHIADTLSRAPLRETSLVDIDKDIDLHCHSIINQIALPENDVERIKGLVKEDEVFRKIIKNVKEGWPNSKKFCDAEVVPYFHVKDDISFINGLLLKNNRIIVPKVMRSEILEKLHEGHFGVQRCQSLARDSVYWPNINNDIHNIISCCEICIRYRNANAKEQLLSHDIAPIPWYKVGMDLFEFGGKYFLLVVDYFSKYVEVEPLNAGFSSQLVVNKLKGIFSRQGIPTLLISDNGPPFSSNDFKKFCSEWGISHQTSSPYLPRSNGLAERTIQTVKKIFKKCRDTGADYYTALLHYRTTRKNNMASPAELLMSRVLRTKLPSMSKILKPRIVKPNENEKYMAKNIENVNHNYNKNTKNLKPVSVGNQIYFKKNPLSVWYPGTIVEICREPRSYLIKDEEGVTYRRNRQHILETSKKLNDVSEVKISDTEINNDNTPEVNEQRMRNVGENYSRRGRKIKPLRRFGFED